MGINWLQQNDLPPLTGETIMKKSIALGFALSFLAAGSAFATPQVARQTVVLEPTYIHATADSKQVAKPFASQSSSTVIVAQNRKEFGSQYQRYE
jgi:hypothetical protein